MPINKTDNTEDLTKYKRQLDSLEQIAKEAQEIAKKAIYIDSISSYKQQHNLK